MNTDPIQVWWKRGVIYEVYVRSFQDTNGDGIGDLEGVISRLDYLQWLGVSIIWLTPVYPSPQADFGYDIANYTDIDECYGSLNTFDRLVTLLHERRMRIVMDLVPNHTSHQHPWFQESSRSRDSDKHDWYLWQDSASADRPPNNWLSEFGGSIWQWHEASGQFYLHTHLREQPDLNWRNPEVRQAIFGAMRFWLDRGVDGFRIDAMTHLVKDSHYRDNPPNLDFQIDMPPSHRQKQVWSMDLPAVHSIIAEMRALVDEYDDRLLIGEDYLPIGRMVSFYGYHRPEVHFPFNFQLLEIPWNYDHLRHAVDQYYASLADNDWPNWVLSNHDRARIATRIGAGQARVAALLMMTLPGTPTIYYGDELGMADVAISEGCCKDLRGLRQPGYGLGRDKCRTPMRWSAEKNAGFSTGEPWLPVGPGYSDQNVEHQASDSDSMLSLYRALISLRGRYPDLISARYTPIECSHGVLAFTRGHDDERFLVAANLQSEPIRCSFQAAGIHSQDLFHSGERLLSTKNCRQELHDGTIPLQADEAVVVKLFSAEPSS